MAATSVSGITCQVCGNSLFDFGPNPTRIRSFYECGYNVVHSESACHRCITKGTEDPKLKAVMTKLDRLATDILIRGDFPSCNELLVAAIKEGEIEVVDFLLCQDASISTTLVNGVSPLYRACEHQRVEIARLLLTRGASSTQKNVDGSTPMRAAVEAGNKALVELLMDHGAPWDEPDSKGRSPVFVAVHSGHEDLALFFIEKGAATTIQDHMGISLLSMAVRCGHQSVVQELVRRGVDVNQQDEKGSTALIDAVDKRNSELLAFLLASGAKDSLNVLWLDQWTPLAYAVQLGDMKAVKLLVDAGADLFIEYKGDFLGKRKKIVELAGEGLRKKDSAERRAIVDFLGERIVSIKVEVFLDKDN